MYHALERGEIVKQTTFANRDEPKIWDLKFSNRVLVDQSGVVSAFVGRNGLNSGTRYDWSGLVWEERGRKRCFREVFLWSLVFFWQHRCVGAEKFFTTLTDF